MPITCTPDNANAIILLTMDYTGEAGTQTVAIVERSIDGGPFEPFIGYGLLCEQGYYYDTTMPLDVPITYRSTSNDGFVSTCTTAVDSGGYAWMKDPGRPFANIRLDLCMTPTPPATVCDPPEDDVALIRLGSESRAADSNLFPVLGNERPVDVFARRKDVVTQLQFATRTCEAIDRVYDLYTAGGPLLFQIPAVYCWPDRFMQPGDLQMDYISTDQRKPWRLWTVPLTAVDRPPINNIQGVVNQTWCCVAENYATYADFTASGLTWADVMTGGAC